MLTMPIMEYHALRKKNPYNKERTSDDDCFWMEEQHRIMNDIYEEHHTKVCPMRALDIDKLRGKAYFHEMLWVSEKLGLLPLMGLRHDYNMQIIHQFFATLYFGKGQLRGYLLDDREQAIQVKLSPMGSSSWLPL